MRVCSWLEHPAACSEADMAPSGPKLDAEARDKALNKRDESDLDESMRWPRVKYIAIFVCSCLDHPQACSEADMAPSEVPEMT